MNNVQETTYKSTPKKHKKHKYDRRDRILDFGGASSPSQHINSLVTAPQGTGGGSLKLILKVGAQNTPEHSSNDMTVYDNNTTDNMDYGGYNSNTDTAMNEYLQSDGSHHHHHSKKNKKKKRKREKKERRHRHHHHHHHHHHKDKKRKHEDSDGGGGGEGSEIPQNITCLGSPSQIHREPRTCVLRKIQERNPVQKMLDQLLPLLEKKDPQQFFAWPVTDNIAPGYSSIITQPMDFSTMRQKIEENEYNSLDDFIVDFKLMCTNALKYNHADTVYYKASKKLLHAGLKIILPEKLGWILNLVPELNSEHMGFEITPELRQIHRKNLEETEEDGSTTNLSNNLPEGNNKKPMPLTKFEAIPDDLTPEEILSKSSIAAREARAKLVRKHGGSTTMGFLKQRKDNTTNLNVIVGGEGLIVGTRKRPVLLGQLCGKLNEGTGQLQGFREDRRNCVKPVKPLYYGAFGSYAPSYDSAFANLTKDESDLIYHTYGTEGAVQYAESILDFVKDNEYVTQLVDSLLDLLTGGEHSRTKKILDDNKQLRDEEEAVKAMLEVRPIDAVKIDVKSLKSLTDLGIDVGFLDRMEDEIRTAEERYELQQKLDSMCHLLEKLQKTQHERLSQPLPTYLTQIPGPTDEEMQLAEVVTTNLTEMVKRSGAPECVTPLDGIRKAMNMPPPLPPPPPPPEETDSVPDLESELRQFLESSESASLTHSPLRDDKTFDEILMV